MEVESETGRRTRKLVYAEFLSGETVKCRAAEGVSAGESSLKGWLECKLCEHLGLSTPPPCWHARYSTSKEEGAPLVDLTSKLFEFDAYEVMEHFEVAVIKVTVAIETGRREAELQAGQNSAEPALGAHQLARPIDAALPPSSSNSNLSRPRWNSRMRTSGNHVGKLDDSTLIVHLEQRLLHENPWTALKQICFDGQFALVQGLCQLGKSEEIALAAFLSRFIYNAQPVVFVKNAGGREAQVQLAGNIQTFNKKISRHLSEITGAGLDSRLSHGFEKFHLHPIFEVDQYRHSSSADAQVIILLSNPSHIQRVKSKLAPSVGKDDEGKLRMVCIFDEDDLNTSSSGRDSTKIEQELFGQWNGGASLRAQAKQVISITATIGAIALSEKEPMQLSIMPVHPHYFGFSPQVPSERRPKFIEVLAEDAEEDESLGFPRGVALMIQDMLRSTISCIGLVHLETRIEEHKKLQHAIAHHFSECRLLVVTHNGGANYQTRKACYQSEAIHGADYSMETNFPLTCKASGNVSLALNAFLEKEEGHRCVDGLHRFGKQCKLMDVLTLLRRFCELEFDAGQGRIVTIIVSGQAGGRGVTFRDKTHQSCVTDMFLARNPDLSGEYLIQIANRLSGKFVTSSGEGWVPPRLQIWSSKDLYDTVLVHHDRLDQITSLLRKEKGKSLKDIVADSEDYVRLTELPGRSSGRCKALRITRSKVEQHWTEQTVGRMDCGNRPFLHGGGDVTQLILDVMLNRASSSNEPGMALYLTDSEKPLERDLRLLLQTPTDEELRQVARKVYPCLDASNEVTIMLLDKVNEVGYEDLPEEIHNLLLNQDMPPARITRLLTKHFAVKTAECLRSSERYGRAGSILRPNLQEGDYCEMVIQRDTPRSRMITLKKVLSLEELKRAREEAERDVSNSPIFAWRAFRDPSGAATKWPKIQFMFARAAHEQGPETRLEFRPQGRKRRVPSLDGGVAAQSKAQRASVPEIIGIIDCDEDNLQRAQETCRSLLELKQNNVNARGGSSHWRNRANLLRESATCLFPATLKRDVTAAVDDMISKFKANYSTWRTQAEHIAKMLEGA